MMSSSTLYLQQILFIILCVMAPLSAYGEMMQCRLDQYHFEYTECDSEGGRWRVSVPKEPGMCQPGSNTQVLPVRGKDCNFVCSAGEYLDIQGDQECHTCPAGTYSLGGGVRFDDWDSLPPDFTVQTEQAAHTPWGRKIKTKGNCTRSEWQTQGNYIMSVPSECPSKLIMSANLVRPGKVTFEYQYTDQEAIFHFVVQNDQCQAYDSDKKDKWPEVTEEGRWGTFVVDLKTGMNVLEWRTLRAFSDRASASAPVLIRKIEVQGVAYTSECTKCRNGTYSSGGTSFCQVCGANSFSGHGASQCTACKDWEYSEPGSAECTPRPACTERDYYPYQAPCNENGQTHMTHGWMEPKICNDQSVESVLLPVDGALEDCPSCNPGMRQVNMSGGCEFCKENHFADGQGVCRPCDVSTSPNYEINYMVWNTLPPNVTSKCISVGAEECSSSSGWVPQGDHLRTVLNPLDHNVFVVLSLRVGGLRGEPGVVDGKDTVLGTISFEIEMVCQTACQLLFLSDVSGHNSVLKTFEDNMVKTMVRQEIYSNESQVFTWAFEPQGFGLFQYEGATGVDNFAKIYNIHVTNTQFGGASQCQSCPEGKTEDGCIPCNDGFYVDPDSQRCKACPEGTILPSSNSWGVDSCKPCGHGLHPVNGRSCKSDCHFVDDLGHEYDLTPLDGVRFVSGATLFTGSGTQYYHGFNITLCNHGNTPLPTCVNNVSADSVFLHQAREVTSMICRATLVPDGGGPDKYVLSTQPVNLGSHLTKVLTNISLDERYEEEGFPAEDTERDIHFFYESGSATTACPAGRGTIISLRCDPDEKTEGRILLPPKCMDGTCDGCSFHFLWHTRHACPRCRREDYKVVKGECVGGEQEIHYFPPEHCIQLDKDLLTPMSQKCRLLPFAVMVAIPVALGVGLFLILLLIYCWSRNKRLEYKYMKLVETAGGQDGELPAADTCGMHDDDEEDVHFSDHRSHGGFFSRIKDKFSSHGRMEEDENPFVAVKMSESMSLT